MITVSQTYKLPIACSKWFYIGKDAAGIQRITDTLGKDKRFYLKDRLHRIAEEFRQPYLDFVAKLGKHQKDPLTWWAGTFASKSPFETDFFLLLCYRVLIEEIIDENLKEEQNIYIFVEDEWVFADVKKSYPGRDNIQFSGNNRVLYKKVFLYLFRGILYRAFFLAYLMLGKTLMSYYHGHGKPEHIRQGSQAVGIMCYAEERAFSSSGYNDPYTGRMSDFLEANGIRIIRLIFPSFPLSLSKKIGKINNNAWPLILELKISDLAEILKCWLPSFSLPDLTIKDYPVRSLLNREVLEEFSKMGFNRCLIFHRIMLRFLRKNWCSALVHVFENQPWEKILSSASKEEGNIKVIGYQHSTVPRFLLMYFLGAGESEIMPLPDKVITNGDFSTDRLIKEGNYPVGKILQGGSWRYEYLLDDKNKCDIRRESAFVRILVALSIDKSISNLMLLSLCSGFPDGGRSSGVEFWIKPHPDVPIKGLNVNHTAYKNFRIIDKPFHELLNETDIVVSSGTAGLEAALHGKEVIRIINENLLDSDPLEGLDIEGVQHCFIEDAKESILEAIDKIRAPLKRPSFEYKRNFFDQIDNEVWLEQLSGS